MAYVGEWGTFIHIPKTGGKWLRWNLANGMGKGTESGPYHGLPLELNKNTFTLVRTPSTWYRSVWWHLHRDDWRQAKTDSPVWNYLTRMLVECKSSSFSEFIVNVYATYPGVYSWVAESLAPPGVRRILLNDASAWMRTELAIAYVDETPIDVQPMPPEITLAVREIITDMESCRYEQII